MASPLAFNIDINDVFRSVNDVRQTGQDFEDDLADLSLDFKHELNKAELYRRILTSKKYGATNLIDGIDERERQSWEDSLLRVRDYEQKFNNIIAKHPQPRADHDAPLTIKSSASLRRSRSRYSWATGGKTGAEKTLNRLRSRNLRFKEELDELVKDYTKVVPSSTTKVENDPDAQDAGISITTTLRTIQREEKPSDAALSLLPSTVGFVRPMCPGASLAQAKTPDDCTVLVEYREYTAFHKDLDQRVLGLATFLNQPKPAGFNVLRCVGVFNETEKQRYGLVFDPRELELSIKYDSEGKQGQFLEQVQSLSSSLGANEKNNMFRYSKFGKSVSESVRPIDLSQRFRMAYLIARTVHQLHIVDWLHQNISSHNIWFTRSTGGDKNSGDRSWIIGEPYLFSFEYARKTSQYSDVYRVDPRGNVDHNLYRHPDRQGARNKQHPHTKFHDIYSLGVVLLEIGLGRLAAGIRDYLEKLRKEQRQEQPATLTPEEIKEGYLDLTSTLVPEKMGGKYAAIVMACISGSFDYTDEDNADPPSLRQVFRSGVLEPLEKLASSVSL